MRTNIEEKIILFNKLLNWDLVIAEIWGQHYEKIKSFVESNKKYPSQYSKNKEEKILYRWIQEQKSAKRGKCIGNLTSDRIRLLEKIPNWKWDNDLEERWMENYKQVKSFFENNGKYPSRHSKNKEEKILDKWLQNQKFAKKCKIGGYKLTPERIRFLENIPNWKWEIDLNLKWNETFNTLKSFYLKNNKYPSRYSKDKNEKILGIWIQNQKSAKRKNGVLTLDK